MNFKKHKHEISLQLHIVIKLLEGKNLYFNLFFLLKDSCFTEFCHFLSNLNMNQPQVYICSLPFEPPPISLPIPPLQVDTEPLFELPEPYSKFPLAIYFTYGNVSLHVTLSIHLILSSPLPSSISLFSMSVGDQVLTHEFWGDIARHPGM